MMDQWSRVKLLIYKDLAGDRCRAGIRPSRILAGFDAGMDAPLCVLFQFPSNTNVR